MKEGRTLVELAQELERQRAAKKDYISDTRNLRMDATGDGLQLSLRDDRSHVVHMLGVNENAHRQIGTALGIPAKYYDKMQRELPDLLAQNVEVSRQNGRCKFDPVHKTVLSFDPVPICRQRKRDGDEA